MQNSVLDDIASVIGYTPTRMLSVAYAGRRLNVPRQARGDCPVTKLIGMPACRALVREFAGEDLFLPGRGADNRFRRDLSVAIGLATGRSCAEMAAVFGLTQRRVEQIEIEVERRGWLAFPPGVSRRHRRRSPSLEILGTGEVSAEPPPSLAAGAAA